MQSQPTHKYINEQSNKIRLNNGQRKIKAIDRIERDQARRRG